MGALLAIGGLAPAVAHADTSWQGANVLNAAGNCGGTCNLKGTHGSIKPPSSLHWELANDSAATAVDDIENTTNGTCATRGCLIQAGFIQTNNWSDGDCTDNDTAPTIYTFYEYVGATHNVCFNSPTTNIAQAFRVQRETAATTWAAFVDGTFQNDFDIEDFTTGDDIIARDEIVKNYLSDESVSATWTTANPWARTSDLYGSGTTTWTTVNSSACADVEIPGGNRQNFLIEAAPSPFLLEWDQGNGTSC